MITKTGVITKKSGDKTVKVQVNSYVVHAKYKKKVLVTKYFLAHDELNQGVEGQSVVITQSRPLSKKKAWVVDFSKKEV